MRICTRYFSTTAKISTKMFRYPCLCATLLFLQISFTICEENCCKNGRKRRVGSQKSENQLDMDKRTLEILRRGTSTFRSFKGWNQRHKIQKPPNHSNAGKRNIGKQTFLNFAYHTDNLGKRFIRQTELSLKSKIVQGSHSQTEKRTTPKRFNYQEIKSCLKTFKTNESERINTLSITQESPKQKRIEKNPSYLAQKKLLRKPRSPVKPKKLYCQTWSTSCAGRCSSKRKSTSYGEKLRCYCDADCESFKDCCADYDTFCKGGTRERNILWECFAYPSMKPEDVIINGIWMIGSCPTTWPKDDIFYKCRNISVTNKITKDNYRYLPVYTSNGTVYHNRFCAQCNGETLDQLKSYELSVDVTPPAHLTSLKKIDFIFDYCSEITWKPKRFSIPRRYCLKVIDSCTVNTSRHQCKYGPVRIVSYQKNTEIVYKNNHCATCNNELNFNAKCAPIWRNHGVNPKALSYIFDFTGAIRGAMPGIRCSKEEEVYDDRLGICRKTLALLPKPSHSTRYDVAVWLKIQGSCAHRTLTEEIRSSKRFELAQVEGFNFKNQGKLLLLRFKIHLNGTAKFSNLLQKFLDLKSPFNYSIGHCTVTVIKATKQLLSCSNLHIFSRNEYTMLGSAVVIKSTSEVLQSSDYYTDHNHASTNQIESIYVCRHNQPLYCANKWVLINEGEFLVLNNKSIFVNSSTRLYNRSEYIWQNRSLFICESFQKTGPESEKDDNILMTLTIVCMSISVVALIFVLVTYSLFAELRTPPGINLMSLSASKLLAQLLWLLGSWQIDKPIVCTAIAVLLHYFFLASFVWTSIIAFDTWRAFTAQGRRSMAGTKRKRVLHSLRYMAVGWLSVMVYVAVCVALDLTNTFTIGYQSGKACWMSNPKAIVFFFAAPVFLILAFNLVMYILTMRAISATTAQARAATDHTNRKHTFGIYVRIASAMGFTWILGFIAPFDMSFLWYPFVVLNGLQGVYIAMAFGLNQRARRLWKRLFVIFSAWRNIQTSSLATKSSSYDVTSA